MNTVVLLVLVAVIITLSSAEWSTRRLENKVLQARRRSPEDSVSATEIERVVNEDDCECEKEESCSCKKCACKEKDDECDCDQVKDDQEDDGMVQETHLAPSDIVNPGTTIMTETDDSVDDADTDGSEHSHMTGKEVDDELPVVPEYAPDNNDDEADREDSDESEEGCTDEPCEYADNVEMVEKPSHKIKVCVKIEGSDECEESS